MKELKDISLIDFEKLGGLVPAVVQDNQTQKVLMVGFMNADAVNKTMESGQGPLVQESLLVNTLGPRAPTICLHSGQRRDR